MTREKKDEIGNTPVEKGRKRINEGQNVKN
jgi:hypothetical protein